ncbi:MAG: DUF4351 domain-containing protein [Stigonema ocellatum SAG 48.90 = DSM 106950]|nr:DUF4351 domain-containing protein [Stigonema ocellatum SAG 48.90 = DSM 106950]
MQEFVISQQIYHKGVQKEIQLGEEALILRLLTRKFGTLEPEIEQRICTLSLTQLDELGEMLLNFKSYSDLTNYLAIG